MCNMTKPMKNIITFLISACLLTACQNEKKQFGIKGKVSNNSKDYALFIHDTTGIGISTIIDTVKIDNNGIYNIENKIFKSNSLLIFIEDKPVRLTIPNTLNTLTEVDLNLLEPDSIKIRGEQASLIKFHLDQQKYWANIYKEMSEKHPELASRNNQNINYHKVQDTITKLRIEYLQKYFKNSNTLNQQDFITAERNSLIYSNLYYRMSGQKNDIVNQLKFYQKPDANYNSILTYSDEIDFSNSKLFSIPFYIKFMNDAIMNIVRFENPKSDLSSYELYLNKGLIIIDDLYKSPKTNNLQKTVFINHLIANAKTFKSAVNILEFQKAIDNLKESNYSNKNLTVIENQLKQLDNVISKFSAGKKAPGFELEDINGKKYKSSDFVNKIIFIDVWASWCGPCISSFPKWNKLVEDYSNSNEFEFLSVSMDKNKSKWTNSLEKFKLKGLKLYAGSKEFESQFATSFNIKALPNYIAIDSKGNIISVSSSINDFEKIIKNELSKK